MDSDRLEHLSSDDLGKELNDKIVIAERRIFGNNGFVIFACKGGFSVKGKYPLEIIPGDNILLSGTVTSYNGKPQVSATSLTKIETVTDEKERVALFLEEHFEGIGKKSASAIAGKFGRDVLDALLNDPDLVAKSVRGMSLKRARECSLKVEAEEKRLRTVLGLYLMGLGQTSCDRITEIYGDESVTRINENPYIIMNIPGIGFETCEAIASSQGFDSMCRERFEGAISCCLDEMHRNSGDTYFEPGEVYSAVKSLIRPEETNEDVIASVYENALECSVKNGRTVVYRVANDKIEGCKAGDEGSRVALKQYFLFEVSIKREVESFLKADKRAVMSSDADRRVTEIARELGYELEEGQKDALVMCLQRPLSIITGGPGTGKTTITGILCEHFRREGIRASFCAPTGRAAKRLSEASGVKAQTIHRLLEMSADDDGISSVYRRGRENPIDARVVVVDEASMIDTMLFSSLLQAVRSDASLILIGDPDQLPSVGPGNVLHDLLSCPSIPRVSLKYVFRQENESSIASNAIRILEGKMPLGNDEDFKIINCISEEEGTRLTAEMFEKYPGDTAILCPTKKGAVGTASLNILLQERMKGSDAKAMTVREDLKLYEGDRVMQMKNNYKIEYYDKEDREVRRGIFNGETGEVGKRDFLTGTLDIFFDDGRTLSYDKKMLADIDLAYAVTVHKSQGCEFDTVIIALGPMNRKLMSRKLLYTAVTRGKKRIIVIDCKGCLQKMVASADEDRRRTSLGDFLKIVSGRTG